MSTNTGGPAFPQCSYNMKGGYDITGGMTLRDYFAAKAMQGMLGGNWPTNKTDQEHISEFSYQLADAMLKARGQE